MDREKVIKGLEVVRNAIVDGYIHEPDRSVNAITDAITLLKEQEAVEPEVEVLNEIDRIYRCPKCHKCFFYEKQKYCDQCGQAVKWE